MPSVLLRREQPEIAVIHSRAAATVFFFIIPSRGPVSNAAAFRLPGITHVRFTHIRYRALAPHVAPLPWLFPLASLTHVRFTHIRYRALAR